MVRATSRESVSAHMDKHTREMQVNTQYWVEMGSIVHFQAQCTHHPYNTIIMCMLLLLPHSAFLFCSPFPTL